MAIAAQELFTHKDLYCMHSGGKKARDIMLRKLNRGALADPQESVIDSTITTPPGSPTEGDRYWVTLGTGGDWDGLGPGIFEFNRDGNWDLYAANEGMGFWEENLDKTMVWDGSALATTDSLTAAQVRTAVEAAIPAQTANAEAADVITVDVQVKDQEGANQAAIITCKAQVLDVNAELTAVGVMTMAETGAGAEVTATARPALMFTTDTNGVAQLSVTDVAGGSGLTVYLQIEALGGVGQPTVQALTFD